MAYGYHKLSEAQRRACDRCEGHEFNSCWENLEKNVSEELVS